MPLTMEPVAPPRWHYPPAERARVTEVRHGRVVNDPYRWLENRDDPRTVLWLAAQQELADANTCRPANRVRFAAQLAAFGGAGVVSPPSWRDGRQFLLRRDPDAELPVVCVVEPDGDSHVLLDPLAIDPSGKTTLDDWKVSWDGRWLAYQVSHRGTEMSLLYVMDIHTRQNVDGPIDRLRRAPVVWAPDSSGFWYVRRLATSPGARPSTVAPRRVFWHRIGTAADDDVLVFGDGAAETTGFWPRLFAHRWLSLRTTTGTSARNTLWLADLTDTDPAEPAFREVVADDAAAITPAIGLDERMYVHTTLGSPRGRICVADLRDPHRWGPAHWQELIAEQRDSVLLGAVPLAGGTFGPERLLVLRTRHAVGEAAVHDAHTGAHLHDITLPGAGVVASPVTHHRGGRSVWLTYTDHATPAEVRRFDLDGDALVEHARPPGRLPDRDVTVRQIRYVSADGTRVRMFVIAPGSAGDVPDRPRPTLLTGYGGFGVSMLPQYRADAMAWVDAGGVFAIACVRGGNEDGEQWHRGAVGVDKQRAIDDFHAAAQWLQRQGWTTSQQLAAYGSSNGGMLVTAAMVQRPDLFRAIAAAAPLTDMVRYEHSGLGRLWRTEYGTVDDPEQFRALLGYSPYHQVTPGTVYPALLITAPDADTRVDPSHSRKLCAAVQHATCGNAPVLLRTLRDTGHGASTRSAALESAAETMAFLGEQTGLLPAE